MEFKIERNPNFLEHHGIPGQKWGVRNGPPYPIENRTLSKGTRLNSVSYYNDSKKYRKSNRWMYMYNPDDEWDRTVYKGPFALYKVQEGKRYVYEHQYETVKDLKMPTSKERIDEFINLYNNKRANMVKDLSYIRDLANKRAPDSISDDAKKLDLNKAKTDNDYKAAYELFNHAMENVSLFRSTREYADLMSKKYDAMVDDNNQGRYNRVHDPVIIFKPDKVLKAVGNVKVVTVKEIMENYKVVESDAKKRGAHVQL